MSAMRRLVANTGVQAVVIVVVKIVGNTGLRVGQVRLNTFSIRRKFRFLPACRCSLI